MFNRIATVLTILLVGIWARSVNGQACPLGWTYGPLQADLLGTSSDVHAILEYDPPGPAPVQLIVAGRFTKIGSIAANHIAAWDGTSWHPLGVGTNDEVLALGVYNNNLIVGGRFTEAGGFSSRFVAAWNGSGWFTIGNGLAGTSTCFEGDDPCHHVRAIAVFNGDLFVGGKFVIPAFGQQSTGIARLFGGTVWGPVVAVAADPWLVNAVQVFGGALYVGGPSNEEFSPTLFRWVGGLWTPITDGGGSVQALTVTNQGLIAGGRFSWDSFFQARYVAAWNGTSWSTLGSNDWDYPAGDPAVMALKVYNGDLHAGGFFHLAGGVECHNVARWDGSNWHSAGIVGVPLALGVHDGELIAGGNWAGEANNLAKYDGQSWDAFTMPVRINALGTIGPSQLVMGGSFAQTYDEEDQKTLQHLAIWNGLGLAPLSGGVNAPVHALKSYTGGGTNHLVVGGEFTVVGSEGGGIGIAGGGAVAANRIALWTQPLVFGNGWEALGNGFNGNVLAVEWLPANQLFDEVTFAAGEFTAAGGGSPAFNRVASWSSPGQWFTMGTGFNGTVRAIKGINNGPINRFVVAGGDFTTASGISANRVAMYPIPNLGGWVAMGSGFNAPVRAIERHNSSWYAAGDFTMSGSTPISHVARWTGTAWESVGSGINGNVNALKSHDGKLYATGGSAFLVWDGTIWANVDGALSQGSGRAIQPFKTEIEVGGDFTGAGGVNGINTSGLARFRYQGLPWIVNQPVSQVAACHSFLSPEFKVALSTGYLDVAEYQWFKNGVPLEDGWNGTGSALEGATSSSTLKVLDASDADEGTYQLTVTTSCGSVTSNAVTLEVTGTCPPCPLDIAPQPAGDGFVGVSDLLMVINSWGACASCPADLAPPGGNGVVNSGDLLAVIAAWGLCP